MKRANGTGSIVRLKGNRRRPYAVKVSGRDRDGYVVQRVLSYHATAREAQAALEEYNRRAAAGQAPRVDMMAWTVGQVYEAWSARAYGKLGRASVASHRAAWGRVRRYEAETFRRVTLDMWQAVLDDDERRGLSQSSIHNDAALIRALCSYAMERDIIGKDYSAYLDIPTVAAKYHKGAFDDLQLARLEQLAAQDHPGAGSALIMCYTGFRVSELLSLGPFSYHPEAGGYLTGGVKTEAGRDRVVPVHPKIARYVQAWVAAYPHLSPQRYRAALFAPLAQALGVPEATPHWCRHTFATRLHAAGVDELTIKQLLGHSIKGDVTAGYIHPGVEALARELRKLA